MADVKEALTLPKIIIDRVAPAKADFVFASTDEQGGLGRLFQDVLEATNLKPPLLNAKVLRKGFTVVQNKGRSTLVVIVTVSRRGNSNELLQENLKKAFAEIKPQISGSAIWLPLMGMGHGQLSLSESFRATVAAVKTSKLLENSLLQSITLAPPTGLHDKELLDLKNIALKELSSRIEINWHIDDNIEREKPHPFDEATVREAAPFYPDHPALVDSLGRESIAEAIATIVNDAMQPQDSHGANDPDRTFIVHVHGRWGSGKTSILNFLRDILISGREYREWIVVDYNAWRNQGHGPAWWSLLNRVYTEAVSQLGGWRSSTGRRLIRRDAAWRWRSGWLPYAIVVATLVALLGIWSAAGGLEWSQGLTIAVSVLALASGVFAFGRTYRIGSARTAAALLELTRDPLRPLTRRYEKMVEEINRPVAVFIDDLDRCDARFVVELLQSIQTLYRRAPVLYVVAADRDWVCCSYEQIYKEFRNPISEPGRPLGHLFLEKIFQLSITVPNLSAESRRDYWGQLVDGKLDTSPENTDRIRKFEEKEIEQLQTEEQIRSYTEQIVDDPLRRRVAGALAFRRMQSQSLRSEREHFLMSYVDMLEPNPRAMKRLVNAYGFKRGFEMMAGLQSPADALVRWTILELRWPELATQLARHPEQLNVTLAMSDDSGSNTSALLSSPDVKRVTEGLSPNLIHQIIGQADPSLTREPAVA